jgi:hypothetical protein
VRDGHAKRLEHLRRRVDGERLADGTLDDGRQQRIAGVRVQVLVAGLEVQRLLPGGDPKHAQVVERFVAAAPGDGQQRVVVSQAARVVYQMPDGDAGGVYPRSYAIRPC